MVKKKLLKWVVMPWIAIVAVTSFSSFTDEDESGANCDMCVVKADGKILFSCKAAANTNCSYDKEIYSQEKGGWIRLVASCAGHVACK